MTSKEILGKLKEFEATPCFRLFQVLVEALIDEARERNDNAPEMEFYKNQGAIRELKQLLKFVRVRDVKRTYDGAYGD